MTPKHGCASALSAHDKTSPTWRMRSKHVKFEKRFDHVVHSKHFTSPAASVIPTELSEHAAVVATLEFKE